MNMCALKYDMESNEVYETKPSLPEHMIRPRVVLIFACLAAAAVVFVILSWIGDKNVRQAQPPQTESLWP